MASSAADVDVSPVTRTREENQERAFVAASRRKDRSLDARLESANRASALHKKRTGKALNITKEIVEKEAMYEEVDERYQEKRLRMLQAQNMQIEEQFQRQLLAAFAAGANSTTQATRVSPDGGVRKMHIDIPSARDFLPNHHHHHQRSMSAVSTPMSAGLSACSPATSYVQSPGGSYMQTPGAFSNVLPQQQLPAYLTPSQSPTWASPAAAAQFQAMTPQAQAQSVAAWRQHLLRQAYLGSESAWLGRQRLASAPDALMMQQQRSGTATPTPSNHDVARAESEPSHPQPVFSANNSQMLSPADLLTSLPQEAWPTPELSPSPTTSNSSPVSGGDDKMDKLPSTTQDDSAAKPPALVSTDAVDPEYDEFTRFALGLESAAQWQTPVADPAASFEDWVTLEALDSDLTLAA
ncbi:hypothetical protein VTN77DRAFT_1279 [Rasamsonia byssochlamydoides]|uniref:uncharacterized protein n=1 Tax=Rasamsonia byssochlamydoides TaxID=89139 RepID=UPI0037449B9E